MGQGMENIKHVVVVMMENRSFDSLLGWLYDNSTGRPPHNIPPQSPTTFEGLAVDQYSNQLDAGSPRVFASRPPTAWPSTANPNLVPNPDPHEEFDHMTTQIFGTASPSPGSLADMSGFLKDYATTSAGTASAAQIMQSYGPSETNVINQLARSFGVCDGWFASCPCQTWPNRGFLHAGSSDGHINNDNYELYDLRTIFNVLEERGISWGVFYDTTLIPSFTLGQFFPRLCGFPDRFHKFSTFARLCRAAANASAAEKLPAYSFVEPRFVPELGLLEVDFPNDYHPPHNVCRGERFLADLYQSVRSSPYRDDIVLVVLFDEHGGCYDHVPPPTGAVAPEPGSVSRYGDFRFDRFGVRVPAIVVSSYVQPGTVFRAANGQSPYDHTSILATLREWLNLAGDPAHPFLPSPRIAAAPTLQPVLTLSGQDRSTSWPDITAQCSVGGDDKGLSAPLNDVQRSLIATALRLRSDATPDVLATARVAKSLATYQRAFAFLHPHAP
jgi:phospholipase C